ncbi:reverse transcriptase domain-containing protein [Tanacetum coccineum]
MIGSDITEKTRSKLCNLIQRSLDIFAWTPTDMTGVPRQITEHNLNERRVVHRFLSKSEGKSLTFSKLEKAQKRVTFLWTEEAEAAIQTNEGTNSKVDLCSSLRRTIDYVEFGISIRPKSIVKGQLLHFILRKARGGRKGRLRREMKTAPSHVDLDTHVSSCVDGCGAGVILTDPEGVEFTYALRFQFETTNNEAEYEALIAGLRIAEKIGVKNLEVNVDSKLVANQVNGTYIAKETDMVKYLEKVKALTNTFPCFSIKQVPRSKNKKADALSKMASTSFAHLSKQVLVEELKEKSVNEKEVLAVVEEEGDTWMTPIHEYLTDETLPAERKKARAIKRKSQRFAIINGILYKKSFLGPWLRCVGPSQANYVLAEIPKARIEACGHTIRRCQA